MPKKQQLTQEANTGKLSRLKEKDLPLIGIDGLNQGDLIAPFGTLTSDIIEYCVYDTSDNYLASGQLEYPLPTNLDIGTHVRTLGYERGTYKVVYNFLRQIGGSNKVILTKKSDKSIWKDQFIVETNGRILAAQPMPQDPEVLIPFEDPQIELLVQEDKFWLQELSPSRTEIRLRPNPAINDPDYFEQFRLLGYTCLSYSDVSGESNVTFNVTGKTVTINGGSISLSQAMVGGTLKIRDAFVIDYDETPEITSRYNPIVETDTLPEANNLVTNGNFFDGNPILERGNFDDNHEIVENIDNPGNSKWVLKTTAANNKNFPNPPNSFIKAVVVIVTPFKPSCSQTPDAKITIAVIVQTIIVSINGSIIATNPSRTGSLVLAAPCAISEVPNPASFEKSALLTPAIITDPTAPPITASPVKAS